MKFSKLELPFLTFIELSKSVLPGGYQFFWKAEIACTGLVIRTWLGDHLGKPFGKCEVVVIASNDCQRECPVQEMWQRAMEKIEEQDFIIVNGN